MLRAFRDQGFVIVPNVFDDDECASLAALVEQVVADQEALLRETNPELLATPGRHGGGVTNMEEGHGLRSTLEVGEDLALAWELARPARFYPEHPRFAAMSLDKRIATLAGELLGGEAMVYADQGAKNTRTIPPQGPGIYSEIACVFCSVPEAAGEGRPAVASPGTHHFPLLFH